MRCSSYVGFMFVLSWTLDIDLIWSDLFCSVLFCMLQTSVGIKINNQLKSTKYEFCWYPCCEHLYRMMYILQVHNMYSCMLLLCAGVYVSLHCCWYTVVIIILSQAVQNCSCVGCGGESPNKSGPYYCTVVRCVHASFLLCVRTALCFFDSMLIAIFLSFMLWYKCVYGYILCNSFTFTDVIFGIWW